MSSPASAVAAKPASQSNSAKSASGPQIPWQDRPAGVPDVVWRYTLNPVIGRRPLPDVIGIYNSAVIPFGDSYLAVFRLEDRSRFPRLHMGRSDDGLKWTVDPKPIVFTNKIDEKLDAVADYAYDPRVVKVEDTYYVIWCGGHNGPTIAMASTKDFKSFTRMENAFLPHNRNGVLFPRKIDGKYFMLSRPSDNGHTPFGDIYLSQSPDLVHWGMHRKVMGRGGDEHGLWWERTKIGAGPSPIELADGWLMIYHGVMDTCNGFTYHMGAAILDLNEPWKVKYRCKNLLLAPEADYEVAGHVPNVVFPVAALCDPVQDKLAVYYGAADTATALCFAHLSELVQYVKDNSILF